MHWTLCNHITKVLEELLAHIYHWTTGIATNNVVNDGSYKRRTEYRHFHYMFHLGTVCRNASCMLASSFQCLRRVQLVSYPDPNIRKHYRNAYILLGLGTRLGHDTYWKRTNQSRPQAIGFSDAILWFDGSERSLSKSDPTIKPAIWSIKILHLNLICWSFRSDIRNWIWSVWALIYRVSHNQRKFI